VGRIENGWGIAKASWRVLSKDRELVLVPLVAGVGSVVAFLAICGPGLLLLDGSEGTGSGNAAGWIFVFVASVIAVWVSAIGQATVVAGAGQRMDGRDPTLGTAFEEARTRLGRLLQWAILSTVVSVILDQIEQRLGFLGRIVAWIGSAAFSVISFLALPVIVFEDLGAIEAFKRSAVLLKTTWGEQIVFGFGLGILSFIALVPIVGVAYVLLSTGVAVLQLVGIVGGVVAAIGVLSITSALSAVFKTALYRYATGRPVDPAFDVATLGTAFRHR
jgi:hypothetical protein